MESNISPSGSAPIQHISTRHTITVSEDATSSHGTQQYWVNIRRRPSIAAMASLLSSSPIKNIHNSWNTVSDSARKKAQSKLDATNLGSDDYRSRSRLPSAPFVNIGKGLFRHKSRGNSLDDTEETGYNGDENNTNGKGRWLQKLASTFRRDRTSSIEDTDAALVSDPFYSPDIFATLQSEDKAAHWPYRGGAAARAAAAAQNEASSLSLGVYRRDLSRLREPQTDSESGIWVDLHDNSDIEETGSIMIRLDPASILPVEVFAHCLSFLDATSITEAELVSKRWHYTANSRAMWRNLFGSEFGRASASAKELSQSGGLGYGTLRPDQEWKKMWKARKALQQRWEDGCAAAVYLEGHTDTVYCVQFDEKKIITGSRDRTLRVWDIKTLQCIKVIGNPKLSGQMHANQPLTPVTRGHAPFTTIIPRRTQEPVQSLQNDPELTHQGSVLCLQFDSETLVTGSSDMTIIIWDISTGYTPIKRLQRHTAGVLDVCFDGHYIVSCSKDTTICLWDRHTGELVRQLFGHRGPVNAVQLRGDLIVSASGDGIAKLWNITSGLCIKEFSSRDRGLACVEFSPDCRYIYAGGNDQSIYQFDAITSELVREFKGHRNLVRSLHLDALNHRVVSGSYDHSIQVYNTQTGDLMCDFAGWTTSWILSAKVDYRRIVATSQDRRVVLIDFGLGVRDIELLRGYERDEALDDWIYPDSVSLGSEYAVSNSTVDHGVDRLKGQGLC